ncbi:LPS assembly lipoprotein LptE [Rurimicrobium arvi]|uniref:Lipopolysaccharide-assembly n=1 Tax=Rurimicrobium arvi TaxID=2049916 RepID=A0ABP8MQE0_9BACT
MILKTKATALLCAAMLAVSSMMFGACGVYSFTGASVEGKTINFHPLENSARNVEPSLSATLNNKIRSRILSQTGLAPVSSDNADYDIAGVITAYDVTVSGAQNSQTASLNQLTISISVEFKNRKTPKSGFSQTFTRFSNFPASQTLQSVQAKLIDEIGTQLADDIFNKAFVNW